MTNNPNNPTPNPQWNLQGWMAAYYAANPDAPPPTPPPTIPITPKKKEAKMEPVTGGWQFEGKEKPAIIRICTQCQNGGIHRSDQITNMESWCQSCKEGKPLGHKPEGIPSPSVSKDADAATLNQTFFGG